MRRYLYAATAVAAIAAVGCVIRTEHTIDARIQVDIRYVEEQADNVLDFIEGDTETLDVAPKEQSHAAPGMFERGVQFLRPFETAHAQEMKNSDSPKIRELAEKLKARNGEIQAMKRAGCLGEDNRGYIDLRDCPDFQDAEKKNAAQKLKAAENEDRKAMYNEFARLNADMNLTVAMVEKIFAGRRLERAGAGEWFQLPAAGAEFDAFKNSAAGKKLGDKAQPGAWVQF